MKKSPLAAALDEVARMLPALGYAFTYRQVEWLVLQLAKYPEFAGFTMATTGAHPHDLDNTEIATLFRAMADAFDPSTTAIVAVPVGNGEMREVRVDRYLAAYLQQQLGGGLDIERAARQIADVAVGKQIADPFTGKPGQVAGVEIVTAIQDGKPCYKAVAREKSDDIRFVTMAECTSLPELIERATKAAQEWADALPLPSRDPASLLGSTSTVPPAPSAAPPHDRRAPAVP